jgi:hypothetical protein
LVLFFDFTTEGLLFKEKISLCGIINENILRLTVLFNCI